MYRTETWSWIVALGVTWAVIAVAFSVVWLQRSRPADFWVWPFQAAATAAGRFGLALRGVIPEEASILVGNGLVALGAALALVGVRSLLLDAPLRLGRLVPALLGLEAYLAVFTWVVPSVPTRVLGVTAFVGMVASVALLDLTTQPWEGLWSLARWVIGVFAVLVALLALRAVMLVFTLPADPFEPGAHHRWLFSALLSLSLAGAAGLVLLTGAPSSGGARDAGAPDGDAPSAAH